MQPQRKSGAGGRRVHAAIHWALLAVLVVGAATTVPRPARAQMPPAAIVVANVAQWMVRWVGSYLLGRGVDFAAERARGDDFRRQLQQAERVLRRQIAASPSNRARLTRELRLVESQMRMLDDMKGSSMTRAKARDYFDRVNRDMDDLRDVVVSVAGGMSEALATIERMQREIDDLRSEVARLRGDRLAGRDDRRRYDGDDEDDERYEPRSRFAPPAGVQLGIGYAANTFAFTVPAYGTIASSAVDRRQHGASARIAVGAGLFQLGVTASALGALFDTVDNVSASDPAARQPMQTVSVGADVSMALTPRWLLRPWIGGAAEQVWIGFRNLPGANETDIVFSGLVYGPQAGLEFRLTDAFSVTVMGRMMSGKLKVPTDELPGLDGRLLTAPTRRNQLTAILSYTERR